MLRGLRAAFGFLTRLPVAGGPVEPIDVGRSLAWFPLVGLVLGSMLFAGRWLLGDRLPPALTGVLLVGLLAALTGGLHLDGLADVFDAAGGGRGDRERMLRIMRDSRIGAHGATALCLHLVAKALALGELVRLGAVPVLITFPAAGRWSVIPLALGFAYARPEGSGKAFHEHGRLRHFAWASLTAAAVLAATGWGAAPLWGGALITAVAVGVWIRVRMGGLTGDVYGAAIELSELAFLVTACYFYRG